MADDLRASQAERDDAVDQLRRHAGDGRLGVDELEQRVEDALGACTRGELAALLADLPGRSSRGRRRPRTGAVRFVLAVSVLLVAIWAGTGAGYFWPMWPIGGLAWVTLSPSCSTKSRTGTRARVVTAGSPPPGSLSDPAP